MKRSYQFDQRKRDIEVRDALRRRLKAQTPLRRVRCDFVEGQAILWGEVLTDADRVFAEELVIAHRGVEAIDNRIQVEAAQVVVG